MTANVRGWRRSVSSVSRRVSSGVAVAAVAVGSVLGASGPALAEPSLVPTPTPTPTVAAEGGAAAGAAAAAAAATATPATGDVLDQLADEYAVGAGGGQLSNLLKLSLKLRSMGFKPSRQYLDELKAAMEYRPNQLPLIDALKDTIAYQQKLKAQMEILSNAQSQQGAATGAGAAPGPGSPASVVATPPPATAPPMPPMP
jgi:hypothetical protein